MVKKFLVEIGIPPEDIIIENKSNNTYENAIFTKEILQRDFPNGRFLLFTAAFHMRRAVACFKKVGMEVTPYGTDRYSGPRNIIPTISCCPMPEHFLTGIACCTKLLVSAFIKLWGMRELGHSVHWSLVISHCK